MKVWNTSCVVAIVCEAAMLDLRGMERGTNHFDMSFMFDLGLNPSLRLRS